jgi:hypothetical protein
VGAGSGRPEWRRAERRAHGYRATVNSLGPGGRVGRLRIANWKLEIGNLAGGGGGGRRAAGRWQMADGKWQMAELRGLTARESRRLRGFAHELRELHEFGLTAAWLVAEGKVRRGEVHRPAPTLPPSLGASALARSFRLGSELPPWLGATADTSGGRQCIVGWGRLRIANGIGQMANGKWQMANWTLRGGVGIGHRGGPTPAERNRKSGLDARPHPSPLPLERGRRSRRLWKPTRPGVGAPSGRKGSNATDATEAGLGAWCRWRRCCSDPHPCPSPIGWERG